jgi:hypothetical protein
MGGWMAVRICVCVSVSCLGSRLGVPAKGIISPSLPDINKTYPGQKNGKNCIGLIGYLKVEFLKSEKSGKIPRISGF